MLAIRKLLGLSIRASWGMSGSAVENYGDDINIWTPQQAAEEERDEWLACS
jgi:hypothetical protein